MERWKKIKDFDNYSVSDCGRVRNDKKKLLLKQINNSGYLVVNLYNDTTTKKIRVHRLVAEAFIPNPNNYPIINHKNEKKDDNRVENLEWCTYKYNSNYGTCRERISTTMKGVPRYYQAIKCIVDGITFNSVADAGRHFNINASTIGAALFRGQQKCKGHTISYAQ